MNRTREHAISQVIRGPFSRTKEHSHSGYELRDEYYGTWVSFCSMAWTKQTACKTEPRQGTPARFAVPTTGAYSKGRKLPEWMRSWSNPASWHQKAATKATTRKSQGRLTDRIFKPDPCHSGFKRKIRTLSLREIGHYQHAFKFLISVRPFVRLVSQNINGWGPYWMQWLEDPILSHHDLANRCRSLFSVVLWRCWFMYHPCQAHHHNAERHPPGTTHSAWQSYWTWHWVIFTTQRAKK